MDFFRLPPQVYKEYIQNLSIRLKGKSMKGRLIIFAFLLLLFSSCARYVQWYKCTFTGGEYLSTDCKAACSYKAEIAIYDQFQTVGLFHILWLSAEVREVAIAMRAERLGLSEKQRQELIEKEYLELKDKIVFYMLTPIFPCATLVRSCVDEPASSLYLMIGDKKYSAQSIKIVDIEQEYLCVIGPQLIRYRQPYKVVFDLEIIKKDYKDELKFLPIGLMITSGCFKASCPWILPPSKTFFIEDSKNDKENKADEQALLEKPDPGLDTSTIAEAHNNTVIEKLVIKEN